MGGGTYRPRFLRAIKTMAPTPTAVSTIRLGSGVVDVTPAKSGALAAMIAIANRSTEFPLFTCSSERRRCTKAQFSTLRNSLLGAARLGQDTIRGLASVEYYR